ncbi:MAG: TadE/TadG family type IV pilus assembly protein [Thermomicrobiales bacterium]
MLRFSNGAQHRRAARGSARGQSLTELALVLPLLALILLGVVDLGRAFFYSTRLSNAVKEGALYGIHYPGSMTSTQKADPNNVVYHTTYESQPSLSLPANQVTVTCYQGLSTTLLVNNDGDCTKAQVGDTVQVKATYNFKPFTQQIIRLLGSSLPTTRTARMVIVQAPQ